MTDICIKGVRRDGEPRIYIEDWARTQKANDLASKAMDQAALVMADELLGSTEIYLEDAPGAPLEIVLCILKAEYFEWFDLPKIIAGGVRSIETEYTKEVRHMHDEETLGRLVELRAKVADLVAPIDAAISRLDTKA